jgi:hypothetical protein
MGFVSTAKSTNVPLVLWENEHFGLLQSASGKQFTESQTYADNSARVKGRIVLSARNADTFGADIKKMNTARLTANEVKESDKFNVMEKQRIKVVFRDLFEQLDKVSGKRPWISRSCAAWSLKRPASRSTSTIRCLRWWP